MDDFSERILCSDGTCVGIINEGGFCNVCGKPLKDGNERRESKQRAQERREQARRKKEEEERKKESSFEDRIPCSDGSCIGIINENGFCNICGKESKNEWERKERENREQRRRQEQDRREREREERERKEEERKRQNRKDERTQEVGTAKITHYFKILGIKPEATREEVKEAFRDLAKMLHPDKYNSNARLRKKAEDRFKEINEAYQYIMSLNNWK